MLLALSAGNVSAQTLRLHARAGVTGSTALVEDAVASPVLAQVLGAAVERPVKVEAAPGLTVGGMVQAAFWPRAALDLTVDWTVSELRLASDEGGSRGYADLGVLQVQLGGSWQPASRVEIGGGAGMLRYMTDERGIFDGGAEPSLTAEVRLGWTPPLVGDRVTLQAVAQTHRFGTDPMRRAGGVDGAVTRLSLLTRIRLTEVGL